MAGDRTRGESGTAGDLDAAHSNQAAGAEYLDRFSKPIQRGKTVLDVGCGDGLPADAFLIKQEPAVNGIDASPRMIEFARKNVPEGFYEVKDMHGHFSRPFPVTLSHPMQKPRRTYA